MVAVARAVVAMVGGITESAMVLVANTLVRRNALERILERPGARALPASPGEAVGRFRDDVQEIGIFVTWTIDPIGQVLAFAVGLAILFRIDPWMTLIVLALLGVVIAHVEPVATARRGVPHGEPPGDRRGHRAARRAVRRRPRREDRRRRAARRSPPGVDQRPSTPGRRCATKSSITWCKGSRRAPANVGAGLMLLFGAEAMRGGSFSVGDFALFVSYLASLAQTHELGRHVHRPGQADDRLARTDAGTDPGHSGSRLVRYAPLYLRHGRRPSPISRAHRDDRLVRLEARGLTYRYPGSEHGIADVDLTIERGSFTVITGRIGSGKTTLVRVLLGLLPSDAGEIRWNGELVDDPGAFLVPPRVAYTSQVPRLFSESLHDNILMGLPDRGRPPEAAVSAALLSRDLPPLEQGLDTVVGPRGVKLSGGQLQRTAVARMLAREPELLVFDDLSSALDVGDRAGALGRPRRHPLVTVLAVSHRRVRSCARRPDRRALRGARRRPRHPGRATGPLRGDAPPLGRRRCPGLAATES